MGFPGLTISLRLLLVAALCTSTTNSMPANIIFRRADSCSSDQASCGSSLPSNFCCDTTATCIALAGNTTAVCCPEGHSCKTIAPIVCDLSQQDPDENPDGPVKTTVFDVALEECGSSQCCPFGYSCKDDQCVMKTDQSEAPTNATTSLTSTISATTSTSVSASTGTASSESTTTASGTGTIATDAPPVTDSPSETATSGSDSASNNSGPATTSIIGGVVGACILLLVITIIIFLYIRRTKKADKLKSEKQNPMHGHSRSLSSAGSFGNIISDPIAQPNSYRTDFIRKSPSRASDSRASTLVRSSNSNVTRIHPTPPRIRISIPNPFDSPNPSPNNHSAISPFDAEPPRHGTVRLPPIRAMKGSSYCSRRPETPELQREPSSESINIFADPGTVKARPLTRATTFTDLMDEADLGEVRRGRPYVPGTTPKI